MEETIHRLETLIDKAAELGKTSLELFKLKTVEKAAKVVSSLIPHTIVFILFLCCLIFFTLGLSLWLGKLVGNTYYGFFMVAAFYAIVALIVHWSLRKWIIRVVNDWIIQMSLKNNTDE